MKVLLLCAALISCACARGDIEYVKGGHSSYNQYKGDINRFYNNYTQPGYGAGPTAPTYNADLGVCYIEVPTASLVKDPAHVPAGNGSRPDLSRIRTCCKGYKRNIYNYRLCEPVCTKECINSLCSAPETCTCYPDHVKNLGGFCVATCPIGCQNGQCAGGECLCKEGYKLDIDGRYCLPNCRANCGGVGNCTAPNTCECKPGYQSTPDGSCHQVGAGCTDTSCVRVPLNPSQQCPNGYTLKNNMCEPVCIPGCQANSHCITPNVCSTFGTIQIVLPGQNPQHPSNGPYQSNTNYNNPNSQYPQPYNQNHHQAPSYPPSTSRPTTPNYNNPTQNSQYPYSNPNNLPGYPQSTPKSTNPYGQNTTPSSNQDTQYSMYPNGTIYRVYPNQNGPNGPNQPQSPNYHQYPSYITHNVSYPAQPLYPGSQIGPQQPGNYPPQNQNSLYPSLTPYNDNTYVGPTFQIPQANSTYSNQPGGHNTQYPYQFGSNSTYPGQQPNQYPSANPSQPGHNSQYPYQFGPNSNYPGQQYGNSTQPQHGGLNPSYPSNQGYNPSQTNQAFNPYGVPGATESDYQQSVGQPQCSPVCVNAVCIDFNRCRCNNGYIQDDIDPSGNRCKPHCPGGCPNGYCSAPYSCACDEGYHKDTSVKGRALCVRIGGGR